jgi:hypothetical protein
MFKYELGQIVYYMKDGKMHSAPVFSRMVVQNAKEDYISSEEKKALYAQFGYSGIMYATAHGTFREREICGSRRELAKQVFGKDLFDAND